MLLCLYWKTITCSIRWLYFYQESFPLWLFARAAASFLHLFSRNFLLHSWTIFYSTSIAINDTKDKIKYFSFTYSPFMKYPSINSISKHSIISACAHINFTVHAHSFYKICFYWAFIISEYIRLDFSINWNFLLKLILRFISVFNSILFKYYKVNCRIVYFCMLLYCIRKLESPGITKAAILKTHYYIFKLPM